MTAFLFILLTANAGFCLLEIKQGSLGWAAFHGIIALLMAVAILQDPPSGD